MNPPTSNILYEYSFQIMADKVGFEPTHDFHRLLRFQRNLLNHLSTYPYLESVIGFEPMVRELQSHALPLGYTLI